MKPYLDFATVARSKWPEEDWNHVSKVRAIEFMDCMQVVRACGAQGDAYRQHSLVYRTLVTGRLYTEVVKANGVLQYFSDGMWRQQECLNTIAEAEIGEACARVQQHLHMDHFELLEQPGRYKLMKLHAPISDGDFVKKVAKLIEDFAPETVLPPLDSEGSLYLLWADGKVFDYTKGALVQNRPSLRLYQHCDAAAPPIEDLQSQPVWEKGRRLVATLHDFYMRGGVDLNVDEPEDEEEEAGEADEEGRGAEGDQSNLELDELAVQACRLLRECADLSPVLKQSVTTLADVNSIVHWQRAESRFWTGRLGFAEAYVLSGPAGCGKSKLLVRTSIPLGSNFDNYGCSMPQQYFTAEDRRGANDSLPAIAKCRNKRFVTTKELRGTAGIRPHCLKNILDQTDVPLDARHNNSAERAVTSFSVTWSIAWAQNGDLKLQTDTAASDGIEDKIVEYRPPHKFDAACLEDHHRPLDASMRNPDFYKQPDWLAHMVMWTFLFDRLNQSDLCPDRVLAPLPPLSAAIRQRQLASQTVELVKLKLPELLEYCDRKQASTTTAIADRLKTEVPGVDASVLTAAGLGTAAMSRRRTGGKAGGAGANQEQIFVLRLSPLHDGGRPVRLRS